MSYPTLTFHGVERVDISAPRLLPEVGQWVRDIRVADGATILTVTLFSTSRESLQPILAPDEAAPVAAAPELVAEPAAGAES